MRTLLKGMLITAAVLASLYGAGRYLYRLKFPYGYSHCCDAVLMMTLDNYAKTHAGRYPAGEASPEASLSLLYYGPYEVGAETLRGKTVPAEVVRRLFDAGKLLDPDSCGWHYVEGLTNSDDR